MPYVLTHRVHRHIHSQCRHFGRVIVFERSRWLQSTAPFHGLTFAGRFWFDPRGTVLTLQESHPIWPLSLQRYDESLRVPDCRLDTPAIHREQGRRMCRTVLIRKRCRKEGRTPLCRHKMSTGRHRRPIEILQNQLGRSLTTGS